MSDQMCVEATKNGIKGGETEDMFNTHGVGFDMHVNSTRKMNDNKNT